MHVIGYMRVSTDEQAASGLGLEAQRRVIAEEVEQRGWTVSWEVDEGVSGALRSRPALDRALVALGTGSAGALVVAKVDRLGRSVVHAADLLERATRERWALVVCDLSLDLATPSGRAMAQMLSVFAELERSMISQRTKAALASARARGTVLGRPRWSVDPALAARVVGMRSRGMGTRAIARCLNLDGTPPPGANAEWRPVLVSRLLDRVEVAV